jgi:hypothetical protein
MRILEFPRQPGQPLPKVAEPRPDPASICAAVGKQFLEDARSDQWRANILIQLAELVGERVDSLPEYIDKLLAIFPISHDGECSLGRLVPPRR